MPYGDAFVVVKGLPVIKAHRELAQRQQAFFLAGDRDAGVGMGVQHAGGVVVRRVDCGMDDEGGDIDAVRRVVELVAFGVDLHEGRRGDLVEQQAVGVDKELVFTPRHARRNVVVDQVVHAEPGDHAIAGGELDAGLPFGGIDFARRGRGRLAH